MTLRVQKLGGDLQPQKQIVLRKTIFLTSDAFKVKVISHTNMLNPSKVALILKFQTHFHLWNSYKKQSFYLK